MPSLPREAVSSFKLVKENPNPPRAARWSPGAQTGLREPGARVHNPPPPPPLFAHRARPRCLGQRPPGARPLRPTTRSAQPDTAPRGAASTLQQRWTGRRGRSALLSNRRKPAKVSPYDAQAQRGDRDTTTDGDAVLAIRPGGCALSPCF